ncbi:MAG: response regulator [Deltaproteobacteria bacterium]|nr:response regulator [Deltaproteobacteria bacterium]
MTIFALTSLLSFVIAVFMGAFLFFRDTGNLLNRLFFVITISIAYFSFIEYGYRRSESFEEASLWWRFDVLWSVHIAVWLHLAMAFSEKTNWLKRKWIYGLIYGPSALFIILDSVAHAITGPPMKQPWGWSSSIRENMISSIAYAWMLLVPAVCAGMFIHYARTVTDARKKMQSRYMLVAGLIPLIFGVLELLLHVWRIHIPPLMVVSFILTNMCVAHTIWKYELFRLTPSRAADSIIETMNDSLVLVGFDSTILTANQATSSMLGYSETELLGKPVLDLFSPLASIPEWISKNISDQTEPVQHKNIETAYLTADGKAIPVSLSGSMLCDKRRHLRGFLLIARDITEQKKSAKEITRHRESLEELIEERTFELRETNVQLEHEISERQRAEIEKRNLQDQLYQAQKMEAIGRLAGGVAHDFNNLLFVINGYAKTLIEALADTPELRNDLEQIQEAGNRAVNLTRQLLAFSRKQIIDPILIDVNERIEASCKMLARMIEEDIQLKFIKGVDEGRVIMDTTQLDQIVANLLVNARDAISRGGTIHICTDRQKVTLADAQHHPERTPGDYITISVIDTGCGIADDKLKLIFEPFFTSKGLGKGTGLGLATVYGIVQQNGGFIDVASKVGAGATFRIFIPCADADLTAEQALQPKSLAMSSGTETVLLVEDEYLVRQLAKRQLESAGYRVLEAIDAQTALQMYCDTPKEIDVLLTDVVMPGMSGVEMVAQISCRYGEPKVIFMSGHNDEIIDTHGIRQNWHPLLAKPFTAEQLCEKVREVIDGRPTRPSYPNISF